MQSREGREPVVQFSDQGLQGGARRTLRCRRRVGDDGRQARRQYGLGVRLASACWLGQHPRLFHDVVLWVIFSVLWGALLITVCICVSSVLQGLQALLAVTLGREALDEDGNEKIKQDVIPERHERHKVECRPGRSLLHAVEEHDVPVLLGEDLQSHQSKTGCRCVRIPAVSFTP